MGLADYFGRKERVAAATSLSARLGFTDKAVPGQVIPQNKLRRPTVQDSGDLERILNLPSRETIELLDFSWLKKRTTTCRCKDMGRPCCSELLPIQHQALSEAARVGGLYASVGVGHGKELVFELLPLVMEGVKTAVLFIGPEMRESFRADWEYYGQHWVQPNLVGGSVFVPGLPRLKVIAYSELSHEKSTAAMRSWDPDLVMGNEAHNLACLTSVRTRRVIDFGASKPDAKFVWGSGTLSVRSIRDSAHLAALALGEGSPFPIDEDVLSEWAAAIDPEGGGKLPALMGALKKLCRPGETAREAFKRRRRTTPGVIDTSEQSIPNALVMHKRDPPPVPDAVRTMLEQVRKTSCRPDGEEFTEEIQTARCLHQLAAGFYYKWIYPNGEPEDLIRAWFSARQAWNREVRDLLLRPRPYLDSPALAMRAALRGELGVESTPEKPVWKSRTFPAWKEVHKLVRPVQKAEWISDWLARDAVKWAEEKPGIVWYASRTFGAKVEELAEGALKRYGGGSQANEEILKETGKRSILVSMKAYSKNFNLQAFNRNLVTQAWPDAAMWEQGLGRTHRRGQMADEVHNWLYLHTPELRRSFEHARNLAKFVEETSPNRMKLCRATYTWDVAKPERGEGIKTP